MKKSILTALLSIIFSLFLVCSSNAQEYGKLYRKAQADSLYGPVKFSVSIPTANLQKMLKMTSKLILFKYNGSKFFIADNNKKALSINNAVIGQDTELKSTDLGQSTELNNTDLSLDGGTTVQATLDSPMRAFSITKVQELITTGTSPVTVIEQRESVLSITNGAVTLEMGAVCPPFCN